MHFLDIDEHFALSTFGQVLLQLLDLGAFAADDDPRTRRAYGDAQFIARPVHFNQAHAGRFQPVCQRLLQFQVFLQELGVTLFGEPAGAPCLIEP